jgi:hypothetical protein
MPKKLIPAMPGGVVTPKVQNLRLAVNPSVAEAIYPEPPLSAIGRPTFEFESDDASTYRHDEQALVINPEADAMAAVDAARCRVLRIENILMPFVSLPVSAADQFDGRDLYALLLTLSGMSQEAYILMEAALHRMNKQRQEAA